MKSAILVHFDSILDRLNALKTVHLRHAVVEHDKRVKTEIWAIQAILHEFDRITSIPRTVRPQFELLEHHTHRL